MFIYSVINKKVKYLSHGERRRLSIAEEIVHGPSLLFIDEPTTELDLIDESRLMMTFREMVNQDKTVIASFHQPSPLAFKLFDTILLLSLGRVIYHGPTINATKFFINSPYNYNFENYITNPGDFLVDIASGQLCDDKNEYIESSTLENYYFSTDLYNNLLARFKKLKSYLKTMENTKNLTGVTSMNPIINSKNNGNDSFTNSEAESQTHSASLDLEYANQTEISRTRTITKIPSVFEITILLISNLFIWNASDLSNIIFKSSILLERASLNLFKRWELVTGSIVTYILLACLFGWIIGSGGDQVYNTSGFFAVGSLILLLTSIQYLYYLFKSNEVNDISCCF